MKRISCNIDGSQQPILVKYRNSNIVSYENNLMSKIFQIEKNFFDLKEVN